jgi:phytoene desaturase
MSGDTTRDVGPVRTDGQSLAGESVTVVGGGIGGLSAAAQAAARGADVRLLERHDRVGGVAGLLEAEGFRFDTGPTWYLMPDVFERFFAQFGRSPDDYYDLERLDPHYRVFWKDGDRADVTADTAQVTSLFESYEAGAGEALEEYLGVAEETYEIGMEQFVYEDRPRLRDFLDPEVALAARGLTFLGSMQEHAADYFDHPKLQQLVQYTLVFLGGSPHNTPALYNLMAHVDLNLGVYYPDGGMASVVDGLADLAREQGVEIETGRDVTGIQPTTDGLLVTTREGKSTDPGSGPATGYAADRVVSNANPAYTERELLPPRARAGDPDRWETKTYAPSAFLLYLGVEGDVDPLKHHTLVLPTDWDDHFHHIFEDPAWPEDPAYYLCVPSETDDSVAPDGHHAVVVLVPIAPGLPDGPDVRASYREKVLSDLADHTGVDLRDRIVFEETACVSEFADRYGAPGGTALGLAHTLRQTGPFRPSHRADGLEGLYYTGGFTTPGIGVPMALISGEHTADAMAADVTDEGLPLPF